MYFYRSAVNKSCSLTKQTTKWIWICGEWR